MKRNGVIRKEILVVGLAMVVLVAVTVVMTLQDTSSVQEKPKDIPKDEQKVEKKESGVQYIDVRAGAGEMVKVGSKIRVIYAGTLKNGTPFDNNIGKEPYDVTIGAGKVIRGWEDGLLGMKQGGKRKLIIPPEMGYGDQGSPPKIPPRAELLFDIEVVSVRN